MAVDYDPRAVEVTCRNLERNGVDGISVHEADVLKWRSRRRFEVVAANLFAGVLCGAMPMMMRVLRPEGRLIVSGILADQWESTREVAERAGLEVACDRKRGKWVSALLLRTGDL